MSRIQWSKVQSELRDRLAPGLRDRLCLRQARYRRTAEEVGRVWIELDGREIISFDTNSYIARRAEIAFQLRSDAREPASSTRSGCEDNLTDDAAAKGLLRRAGLYDDYSAIADLEGYLSLSIEDALSSPSPLVRALAVADRRVGKRRLKRLAPMTAEHPLVRQLFVARCVTEGIDPDRDAEGSGPAV